VHGAWAAIDALLGAPAAVQLRAGERHWTLFRRLAVDIDASGNDIADAYLAAYALENNATWHIRNVESPIHVEMRDVVVIVRTVEDDDTNATITF
jgi:predicted nucleic acid-binding protein